MHPRLLTGFASSQFRHEHLGDQAVVAVPLTAPIQRVHSPRHIALLDDVLTTGNTALAAMTALRLVGVERVDLWCCARTLRQDGADCKLVI